MKKKDTHIYIFITLLKIQNFSNGLGLNFLLSQNDGIMNYLSSCINLALTLGGVTLGGLKLRFQIEFY